MKKLDILIFSSHPDDAELGCSGTILKHIDMGFQVGIVDLTKGELGTRGTPDIRMQEANDASKILGISARVNLEFSDGFFSDSMSECLKIMEQIRYFQPKIILCNAPKDRHPDHGKGNEVVVKAAFLSGLRKIETKYDGLQQDPWRAKTLYSYIQDQYLTPDFIVDITSYWEQKKASILAYRSQFYNPESDEPSSYISSQEFIEFIEARNREMGHAIGAKYGEGFIKHQQLEVKNLFDLQKTFN